MMAIESGSGLDLLETGILVDLNKETGRAQELAELHGKELEENEIKSIGGLAVMREAA